MKKSILFVGAALCALSGVLLYVSQNNLSTLCSGNVEALASCEILDKKGQVVYSCSGEEGVCKPGSALGHTLVCSGTEVTK